MDSKLPNRLKILRNERAMRQEDVANEIGVTIKTYRTWEKDIDKMKSGIKSSNLIELARLYEVSTDYLLGLSDCRSVDNHYISQKTGLNDEGIYALEMIKLQDKNERENGAYMKIQSRLSLVDVMNFTFKHEIESILMAIRNFLNIQYKIPVFFDKKKGEWICPKSDYEFSKGKFGVSDLWWLSLASSENMPYDNSQIPLTDTFFESVALKDIEKRLYDLRNIYNEIKDEENIDLI